MKTKPKTDKQIDKEIAAMKKLRPKVLPFSLFGDDNLKLFDATIRVLEERMDDMDIDENFEPLQEDGEDDDENIANGDINQDEGRSYDIASSMREVVSWMDGTDDGDAPSKGWPLIKK